MTVFWLILLLLPVLCSTGMFDNNEDPIELYNEQLITKILTEIAELERNDKLDLLRHKIGVLGVYMRMFKELVPTTTRKGFPHLYPEPQNEFNGDLGKQCLEGIEKCIDHIFGYLQPAHSWILPGAQGDQTIELNRERMEKLINDAILDLELSASQVLCFFTISRVPVFEFIPFCGYSLTAVNSTLTRFIWPGGMFRENPSFFDEIMGNSYDCAMKSFCPDPCCSDVDKKGVEFTERDCRMNVCKNPAKCSIKPQINDQMEGIRSNNWNISCPCGEGLSFRPDVSQCVHDNICGKKDVCPPGEECENVWSGKGYRCLCQLGTVRTDSGGCEEYGISGQHWDGFARSEPHPRGTASISGTSYLFLVVTNVYFL